MDELKELPAAWRWMPGMLVDRDGAMFRVGGVGTYSVDDAYITHGHRVITPVLDDPATLGCLLALVRAAHGDSTACCFNLRVDADSAVGERWVCHVFDDLEFGCASEAGAMLAALRALNGPEVDTLGN